MYIWIHYISSLSELWIAYILRSSPPPQSWKFSRNSNFRGVKTPCGTIYFFLKMSKSTVLVTLFNLWVVLTVIFASFIHVWNKRAKINILSRLKNVGDHKLLILGKHNNDQYMCTYCFFFFFFFFFFFVMFCQMFLGQNFLLVSRPYSTLIAFFFSPYFSLGRKG